MPNEQFDLSVEQILHALTLTDQTTATPVLFLISGLPGTGKSFLSRRLAERVPLVIVSSDFVRSILTNGTPTYSAAESALVHQVGRAVLKRLLTSERRVIYDATNLAEWHREKLYRLAGETHSKLVIIRTIAPENIVRERLRQRAENHNSDEYSEADWDVHKQLKQELEPIRRPHIVVDTSQDITPAILKILRAAR